MYVYVLVSSSGQFYEIHKIIIIIYYSHFTNVEADQLSVMNTTCWVFCGHDMQHVGS